MDKAAYFSERNQKGILTAATQKKGALLRVQAI